MKNATATETSTKRIDLTRHSPQYWRVTLNHPPLNVFGLESIPQLNEIVTALETDEQVKVVVFDSTVEGFFLTHYDFLAKIEDTTSLPPRPTGLQPVPDTLVRLSRALTDDVVDVFFSMLTNWKVTGDKIGPHEDLLDQFPYLGPPHNVLKQL